MTDTAYIDARNYGDDGEGRRKLTDIDWSAWREQLENWLKRAKGSSGRVYQSAKTRAQNIDSERMFEQFKRVAIATSLNTLAPMFGAMAGMALLKMGIGLAGGPVAALAFGIGFGAFSVVRNYNKAKSKFENDCVKAQENGEDEPKFGLNYLWPVILKGALTTVFAGFGVMQVAEWDLPLAFDMLPNDVDGVGDDNIASLTASEDLVANDAVLGADEVLQPAAIDVDAEVNLNNVDGDVVDTVAAQPVSYDVEFGSNFELPESPTAVDRMAAMMPDDASPEVIEALEAARDGHAWGVHNLAYHLSFEHGGLELDEAGKQLVLDLYAEAASEGHQISIDNLATLENMWDMEAEGFDTPAVALGNVDIIDGDGSYSTLDLNSREELRGDSMAYYGGGDDDTLADDQPSVIDTYLASLEDGAPNPYDVVEVSELPDIVDDQPSVIDMYVASLADDAPNPYDVIEVSALPPVQEPIVNMADAGGPIDLTVNLGASLADMPEGYVPEVASLGVDDGVSYGSAPVVENTQLADAVSNVDLNDEPEQVVAAIPTVATCDLSSGSGAASAFNVQCSIDQDDWVQGSEILINDNRGSEPVSYAFINNNADSKDTATTLRAMFNGDAPQRWLAAVEDLQEVEPNNVQYASVGGPDRPLTP